MRVGRGLFVAGYLYIGLYKRRKIFYTIDRSNQLSFSPNLMPFWCGLWLSFWRKLKPLLAHTKRAFLCQIYYCQSLFFFFLRSFCGRFLKSPRCPECGGKLQHWDTGKKLYCVDCNFSTTISGL